MARKKSFTLTQPPVLMWLALMIMGFFLVLMVVDMLATSSLDIAMAVVITMVILIPCTLIFLWAKFFRIKVEGTTISVRRFFGIVNYRFDVTDITAVRCITVQNRMGQNQNIKLYTSTGKKVPVETLMVNSEKMNKFIEENVDQSKFQNSFKTFR